LSQFQTIESRRLKFTHDKSIPKYWNDNCPIKTHLLNAIAMLAPSFERLVISSVVPFRQSISDPVLSKQVEGFIGQESAHGSEFIRYNQVLKSQGYEVKKLEKSNLKKYKWLSDKFSPMMHLSLSLAGEHLTAIISDLILRDPQWLAHANKQYGALWRWHAIEEIEHKSVVFDLYRSLNGGYWRRLLGMWFITHKLGGLVFRNFFYLLKKDGLLLKPKCWQDFFKISFGRSGFVRQLIGPYCRYLSPFFHPWQHDNQPLIRHWKERFAQAQSLDEVVLLLEQTG